MTLLSRTGLHTTTSLNNPKRRGHILSNLTNLFPCTGAQRNFLPNARKPTLSHVRFTICVEQELVVMEFPSSVTVMFLWLKTWGTAAHLLAGMLKLHDRQHSPGLVTTGKPKQSSSLKGLQPIAPQRVLLLMQKQVTQGSGCHWTLPSLRKLTHPSNLQLLFSHDGQHSPGGMTGSAQRGRLHVTRLQSGWFSLALASWMAVARRERRRRRVVPVRMKPMLVCVGTSAAVCERIYHLL